MSADGTMGWYMYRPDGSLPVPGEDEEAAVELIRLRPDPDAGPFWEPDQLLSDDFDELHHCLGISRETYDAAMAWSERWADGRQRRADRATCERERQSLIARMRAEAHDGISFE